MGRCLRFPWTRREHSEEPSGRSVPNLSLPGSPGHGRDPLLAFWVFLGSSGNAQVCEVLVRGVPLSLCRLGLDSGMLLGKALPASFELPAFPMSWKSPSLTPPSPSPGGEAPPSSLRKWESEGSRPSRCAPDLPAGVGRNALIPLGWQPIP